MCLVVCPFSFVRFQILKLVANTERSYNNMSSASELIPQLLPSVSEEATTPQDGSEPSQSEQKGGGNTVGR